MPNIYNFIMDLFQSIASSFGTSLTASIVNVLKINILFTAIGMIIIITFAVKKMQDNDLFTIKTMIAIVLMLCYLALFNWAMHNPQTYFQYFSYLIDYPSNAISKQILGAVAHIQPQASSGNFNGGIDVLIQQALNVGLQLLEKVNISIGFTGMQGTISQLLAGIAYFLCTLIFTILVLFIIIVASLQVMIWKSLSIIIVALGFLPQTRGLIGKYIMFLITLTMYKPMVLTIAFFNTKVSQYVLSQMPNDDAFKNASMIEVTGQQATIVGYIALGIIGCFICVFLVKQVPDFLSNIIGSSTSVGKGMATAATGAMALATGAAAAGSVASATSPAKAAYQAAGGGLGGIANAAAGIATMGLSNKLGGNKLGEKANDTINKSKAGNFTNNALSKGISAGTNAVKGLGNKLSGKG